MLPDINKPLLNEMGITAIGDCLSILKHSKIIITKIEDTKKEITTGLTSTDLQASKKRCEVAKRIIENYLGDADVKTLNEKPVQSASTLSHDLISRLNFNSNVKTPQVVKFNEGSLNNSKVVVSSTTNDDEPVITKNVNLKRKLADDGKPLEYLGFLKNSQNDFVDLKPNRTLSLNEAIKLKKPIKNRLSTGSISKIIKLNVNKNNFEDKKGEEEANHLNNKIATSLESIRIESSRSGERNIISLVNKNKIESSAEGKKESVFKRIKTVIEGNEVRKFPVGIGGLKSDQKTNIVPISLDFKTTRIESNQTVNKSKVISLTGSKSRLLSSSMSMESFNPNWNKSVQDRLSFGKKK